MVAARARRGLACLAVALLVASCGVQPSPCPFVKIVSPLNSLTRFTPGVEQAPANVEFQAQLTDVALKCEYSDVKNANLPVNQATDLMEVRMKVQISALRGPAAGGDEVALAYFVAVTDTLDNVLEKEEFPLRLRFPVNSRNATFTEENWMLFRLRGRSGLAYRIWTGFQLTPEESEYNHGLLAD